MTKDEKKEVALFRYSIISELVNVKGLNWGEQERIIREKCARRWSIPFSEKTSIGRSSIISWVKAYRESNGNIITHCTPRSAVTRGKTAPFAKTHALPCLP